VRLSATAATALILQSIWVEPADVADRDRERRLALKCSSTWMRRDRLPSLLSEVRYRRVGGPF